MAAAGVTCPDGITTCQLEKSLCIERDDRPGSYYCDCDTSVARNANYTGLTCQHNLGYDCREDGPGTADPKAAAGKPLWCFNSGVCSFDWDTNMQLCECPEGFSGDFCQFLGDPEHSELNPVSCPDGKTICEHGSTCYEYTDVEGNGEGKYYCDCAHAGINEELEHGLVCMHETPKYCKGATPNDDKDIDAFCYNGGTCHHRKCNCPHGTFGFNCQFWSADEVAVGHIEDDRGMVTAYIFAIPVIAVAVVVAGMVVRRFADRCECPSPSSSSSGGARSHASYATQKGAAPSPFTTSGPGYRDYTYDTEESTGRDII